jgi:hypothetical protein
MIPRDFSKQLRRELASGKTLDEALVSLRASGASIFDCIVAIRSVRQYSLEEAKQFIHDSPAWADARVDFDDLHDDASGA